MKVLRYQPECVVLSYVVNPLYLPPCCIHINVFDTEKKRYYDIRIESDNLDDVIAQARVVLA